MAINRLAILGIVVDPRKAIVGARRANTAIKGIGRTASSIKDKVFGLQGALVALGGGLVVRSFLTTASSLEKLKVSLKTVTGSAENADKAFKQLTEFTTRTPYEVDQVASAFIKLKAFGLDPSEAAMTSFGNTASAMGKDLDQMIEAVADAATMEFERLKEFGIKSKQEGDFVKFTFQGITTTVKKNAEDIQGYLMDIGNNQFGGAMADQMNTMDGALSNFRGSWTLFQDELMNSGPFDLAKGLINSMSESLFGDEKSVSENARKAGQSIVDFVRSAVLGTAAFVDSIGVYIRFIRTQVSNLWDTYRSLPTFVQSVGIIGALLGGTKLKFLIASIIFGIGQIKDLMGGNDTIDLSSMENTLRIQQNLVSGLEAQHAAALFVTKDQRDILASYKQQNEQLAIRIKYMKQTGTEDARDIPDSIGKDETAQLELPSIAPPPIADTWTQKATAFFDELDKLADKRNYALEAVALREQEAVIASTQTFIGGEEDKRRALEQSLALKAQMSKEAAESLELMYWGVESLYGEKRFKSQLDAKRAHDALMLEQTDLWLKKQAGVYAANKAMDWGQELTAFEEFSQSFTDKWIEMEQSSMPIMQRMGDKLAEIFAPGGTFAKGIGDSIANMVLLGKSGGDAMKALARTITHQVLSSLISLGVQQAVNFVASKMFATTGTALSVTQAGVVASAWAPAAAAVSLATMGTNAVPASAGMASAFALSAGLSKASFEGGGFTGTGPRSGGVDGKGGFPAILHPNETVTDHTKGQRGNSGAANVTFNINAIDTSDATRLIVSQRGTIIGVINQALNESGRPAIA
jgi:hypothetical protein